MSKSTKSFIENFVKENEHLSFDKTLKADPKLTIRTSESLFEYLSSDGKSSSALFKPNTSEYKILSHLIENLHMPVDTSSLVELLNEPRKDADGADNKQRARDKIKAIAKKLGKGLIKRTTNGYVINCEVIRV